MALPRVVRRALACLALSTLCAARVGAQDRIVVRSEAGTPVVATEVLIAAGPADEPQDKAGLAYLAARTVVAPIQRTMDSLGVNLDIAARKDAITFTVIAAPDAWEEATRSLLVALFRDPPDRQWMLRQQRAITAELTARESNPADAMLRTADAAVFGEAHPWGRSTVGSPATVQRLTMEDVDRFLRTHVTSRRAVIAVVGPVESGSARAHLAGFLDAALPLPPLELARPETAEQMVRKDYNSITTWVSVSYFFPATADVEALEFLARLAMDELSFSPTRRSVFNVRSEVIPRRAGSELRLQLVTPPEEAEEWANRVRALISEVAEREMSPDLFAARLRRYRGERLHGLSAPEDRARDLARQLLVSGRIRGFAVDLDSLTLARLRAAVRSLEAPTVVLLGPIPDAEPAKGD